MNLDINVRCPEKICTGGFDSRLITNRTENLCLSFEVVHFILLTKIFINQMVWLDRSLDCPLFFLWALNFKENK